MAKYQAIKMKDVTFQMDAYNKADTMTEQLVCDGIDLKWMAGGDSDDEEELEISPTTKFHEKMSCRGKVRRLLLRKARSRIIFTFFDVVVKVLCCVLYFVRVQTDDINRYKCGGSMCLNGTEPEVSISNEEDGMKFTSSEINWHVLLWVHRPLPLWIVQVVLAVASFSKTLLLLFITKENKLEQITSFLFVMEVICSLPFIVTIFYPVILMNLYVPAFLNCWLLKSAIERLFNDLHFAKQRFQTISTTMSQQIFILIIAMICIFFTTICGIQHLQRASLEKPLTMFESLYFTIVTFSTVGYGDISPDIWPGQLFMVVMICVAIAFIPRQIERIITTFMERQKTGGNYSKRQALRSKHVIVCCQFLTSASVMNFLTEFYAHRKLQNHIVILLCPVDPESDMHMILRDPKWSNRVRYMKGSALKDIDLMRCRINEAECLFLLSPAENSNKEQADQQNILKSWAVKDFAPNCNQYIQLFRAENKMHVKFAEHVVCEDEFKYALLANNCLYPGISTLVSLLLHTSTGYEGDLASEPWQQVYGKHSGNEIYHIQLCYSKIFNQFENRKFTEASVEVHEKFGVTLLAVMDVDDSITNEEPKIQLNPGPSYILKKHDFCFYMSVSKEENTNIANIKIEKNDVSQREKNYEKIAQELQRMISDQYNDTNEIEQEEEESVFNTLTSISGGQVGAKLRDLNRSNIGDNELRVGDEDQTDSTGNATDASERELTVGRPPATFFVGPKNADCHLMKVMRSKCCLKWGEDCIHVNDKNANAPRWGQNLIILTAQRINQGLYNFILPLRSCFISIKSLRPIILMFEEDEPSKLFLETIAHFPHVYWMKGKLVCIDDLLTAGINKASHLIVVNREITADPSQMVDAETIVNVQTIHKLFPNINILTELSEKDNMRFMHFQANDEYTLNISRLEKKLKEHNCILTHLFRLPFAAGHVLSGAMLDTLLYQTFVKGYLIKFVRLLLGIDAEQNSGHLSSIKVKRQILAKYRTYGDLYKGLCTITGEIPIAIYRTERRKRAYNDLDETSAGENNNSKQGRSVERKVTINVRHFYERSEQNDVTEIIRNRMKSLHMDEDSYGGGEPIKTVSYIILNPTPSRKLKMGDLIYVIQPSSMFAVPSRLTKKPIRRMSWASARDAASLFHTKRDRSKSIDPDLASQTIHEISHRNSGDEHHEITTTDVAKKIKSKVFVTEKVKELDMV
ncbi:potassium channel subfamily T member 2-like isoform X1 [Mytilus trossulus]|uniref:potassium channel subfamily T member 2-like isoform X1 n=3 Tax=Mytilus trossulus TaxID=6551 RepID=UPI003005BA5C